MATLNTIGISSNPSPTAVCTRRVSTTTVGQLFLTSSPQSYLSSSFHHTRLLTSDPRPRQLEGTGPDTVAFLLMAAMCARGRLIFWARELPHQSPFRGRHPHLAPDDVTSTREMRQGERDRCQYKRQESPSTHVGRTLAADPASDLPR